MLDKGPMPGQEKSRPEAASITALEFLHWRWERSPGREARHLVFVEASFAEHGSGVLAVAAGSSRRRARASWDVN